MSKPPSCHGCPLYAKTSGFAAPWGNPDADIWFCGEALGADEEAHGRPFVGDAGRTLFQSMKNAGIPSDPCACGRDWNCTICRGTGRDFSRYVYIHNLVQCRPPGNNFGAVYQNYSAIDDCAVRHVAKPKPGTLVFLLGANALNYFFPRNHGIHNWQGSLLRKEEVLYVPCFHPAYLRRDAAMLSSLPQTFHSTLNKRGELLWPKPGFITEPGVAMALDVETNEDGMPILVGVSIDGKEVESIDPISGVDRLRALCDSASSIIAHNADFDRKALARLGIVVPPEKWVDTMLLWQLTQPDYGRGLDDLARYVFAGHHIWWKPLGRQELEKHEPSVIEAYEKCGLTHSFENQEQFYNAIDVIATYRGYDIMLSKLTEKRRKYYFNALLPAWRTFWAIEAGGMRIDRDRLAHWKKVLERTVRMGESALRRHPLVQDALAKRTEEAYAKVRLIEQRKEEELANANEERRLLEADLERWKAERATHPRTSDRYKELSALIKEVKLPKLVRKSEYTGILAKARAEAERATDLRSSGPQKLWLVYDVMKCPHQYAERKAADGSKSKTLSANKASLERLLALKSVHPEKKKVIKLLLSIEHWSHWLSNFASLEVNEDGYVYPRIQIRTATARAASGADSDEKGGDSPTNAQNWPKPMRDIVLPEPDQALLQADYSQQEWLVQLWLSGDRESYYRTVRGEEDRHRKSASVAFGVQESEVTPEQRKTAKIVNYATAYGATAKKIADVLNTSELRAQEIIDGLRKAYPRVAVWQELVLDKARRQKYLETGFGWIRYFPRFNPNQALAFTPSASGAGMMHAVLPKVEALARAYGGRVVTSTHDSFLLSLPPTVLDEVRPKLKVILEEPRPELDGFSCPVDMKVGYNWKEVS